MENLHLVYMECDDMNPMLIGVGTSKGNAEAIARDSAKEFDTMQYRIVECVPNAMQINSTIYLYENGEQREAIKSDGSVFKETGVYYPEDFENEGVSLD